MIVIRPSEVKFGSDEWTGVTRVSVDRMSSRTIDEWDDFGPHAVFVDVARQRVVVRVSQEIEGDKFEMPTLGELGEFEFSGSNGSDAQRIRVRIDAVVESVLNKVSDFGSTRVITLIGVSSDGSLDPVRVS